MSLVSLVVVPPALFILRKMVRRIYHIALNQFVGGTRLLETLQETVQGIRTSRRSRSKTRCARGCTPTSRTSKTNPTAGRGSRTAPAR